MPKVSIIVLNYNGKKYLQRCLNSIFNQTYQDFELILVDNASTDGSVEYVKRNYPDLKIIVNKTNLGFAGGNNVGVRTATGEYIVLLNNDTEVPPNWLEELLKGVTNKDWTVCAMSKIYTAGVPKHLYEKTIGTLNIVGKNILTDIPYTPNQPLASTFYASGCALIYKKGVIEQPFDPDYFAYGEDVYFGWHLRLLGYNVVHVTNSIVQHMGSSASKKIAGFTTYYSERNRLLNILIFYEKTTLYRILPIVLLDIVLKLFDGGASHKVKSYFWILANIDLVRAKRRKIQRERKVSDNAILRYMSYKLIQQPGRIGNLINRLAYMYCKVNKLYTMEFYSKSCPVETKKYREQT